MAGCYRLGGGRSLWQGDPVPLREIGRRRLDLCGPPGSRPAQHLTGELGEFEQQGSRDSPDERETRAAIDQIGEVHDVFLADEEADLVRAVAIEVLQRSIFRAERVD